MKILYLLFAFLFLAFLTEPGNAQPLCRSQGGSCIRDTCSPDTKDLHRLDCEHEWLCCRPRRGK